MTAFFSKLALLLLVFTTINFPLLFIFPTANIKTKNNKKSSQRRNKWKHEKKEKKESLEEKEIIRLTLNYC